MQAEMITICWLRITSIFDAAQQTTDHDVAMLNNEKKDENIFCKNWCQMGGTYGEHRGADWNLKKVSPDTTTLTHTPPLIFLKMCSQILSCQLQN